MEAIHIMQLNNWKTFNKSVILSLASQRKVTSYMQKITTNSMPFGEGTGTPLQYSCLETPMDGGAWWAAVHGVAKSRIRLSDFPFTFHFHVLEREMATHSSVLALRIPGTEEPDGLLSMGSHRVGHDWSDLAAVCHCLFISYNCIFFNIV